MSEFTAILIVDNGSQPHAGRWLELCIGKVREHTQDEPYRLYVGDSSTGAPGDAQALAPSPDTTVPNQQPMTSGNGQTAPQTQSPGTSFQRLYEAARADGARYIVTLEADAHPIRSGWLTELKSRLNCGASIAGIWHDESPRGVRPVGRPICLCTTVGFLEKHGLRLDSFSTRGKRPDEALACLTEKARELGLSCQALRRSNRNTLGGLASGIYGDLVYHHGIQSRPRTGFWDLRRRREAEAGQERLRDETAALLFRYPERFIEWMRGSRELVFVLGMHRSGTSCVAGALERCGLFLGDVSRSNLHNPRGNQELPAVIELHERILRANGGSWSSPPQKIDVSERDRGAMREVVDQLAAKAPSGLKEPRMLLFLPYWLELAGSAKFVGSFRHPAAVARSLARRDRMSSARAHELWLHYNRQLIELHRKHAFPLLEFDLSGGDAFCRNVAAAAVRLGLYPNLEGVRQFVSRELDHSDLSDKTVPAECEDAYRYLLEHCCRADPFEKALVELARQAPARPQRHGGIGGYLRGLGRRLAGQTGS